MYKLVATSPPTAARVEAGRMLGRGRWWVCGRVVGRIRRLGRVLREGLWRRGCGGPGHVRLHSAMVRLAASYSTSSGALGDGAARPLEEGCVQLPEEAMVDGTATAGSGRREAKQASTKRACLHYACMLVVWGRGGGVLCWAKPV